MTSVAAPPAHRRLPGDLAIWFFILAEMLAFAVFFATYAFARAKNVEMFNLYQHTLDRNLGGLNTLLLITGSWFVVLAVQAAHRDDQPAISRTLAAWEWPKSGSCGCSSGARPGWVWRMALAMLASR